METLKSSNNEFVQLNWYTLGTPHSTKKLHGTSAFTYKSLVCIISDSKCIFICLWENLLVQYEQDFNEADYFTTPYTVNTFLCIFFSFLTFFYILSRFKTENWSYFVFAEYFEISNVCDLLKILKILQCSDVPPLSSGDTVQEAVVFQQFETGHFHISSVYLML